MDNLRYFFEALPWLGFFATIILSWYFYLKARNKERMALIEKGADVSEIFSRQEVKIRFPWLKIGILISGISLGVIAVAIFTLTLDSSKVGMNTGPFVLMGGVLFGGISMIIAHFVDRPARK